MENQSNPYEIVIWEPDPDDKTKKHIIRIPTTREAFDDYYRPINAYRKNEQRHGRCFCPIKCRLLCNMDCGTCSYSVSGDTDSLDESIEDDNGNLIKRVETLPAETDIEADYEYADLIHRLHEVVNDLSLEGMEICRLIMAGKNEREMADKLNIPKTTLHRRKESLLNILHEALEKYYY